jgi:thiamine pyrophosphate-dependent acetolactate synthase large subunit-like protein
MPDFENLQTFKYQTVEDLPTRASPRRRRNHGSSHEARDGHARGPPTRRKPLQPPRPAVRRRSTAFSSSSIRSSSTASTRSTRCPGIPITDLTRRSQAEGLRVLAFRHEQNAGYAASIAGFLTQKPGVCLTVSAPGFLNGLNALAHATVNCFPMILISGSSEREVVDLQQGDYEEMDQLAIAKPVAKAAYRVLHADDIGVGIARPSVRRLSGRPGAVSTSICPRSCSRKRSTPRPAGSRSSSRRRGAEADSAARRGEARARPFEECEEAVDHPGQGRRLRAGRRRYQGADRKSGIPYLPMSMAKGLLPDTHDQCASAARSFVLPAADVVMLIGARLNWLLSHGKGKTWGGKSSKDWGGQKFIQVDISPQEADSNVRIDAPVVGDIGSCVSALLAGMGGIAGPSRRPTGRPRSAEKKQGNVAKMAETLAKNPTPMNFHSALNVVRDIVKANPDAMLVNEGANALDFHPLDRRHVQAAQADRRRHLGNHGRRDGLLRGGGRHHQAAGDRDRGRQRVRLLRHGSGDDLPLQPAGLHRDHEQQRCLQGHRRRPDRPRSGADGVREGRALREADGGVRRRGRGRATPAELRTAMEEGDPLPQADADQRSDRRERGHRERPHHEP